jgi:hypothetical protein
MKLYHGTARNVARRVFRSGLRPRSMTGRSNWEQTVESCPDAVYLTRVYGPYFSRQAAAGGSWESAIIEVDTDHLLDYKFTPDEDFLAHITGDNDKVAKQDPALARKFKGLDACGRSSYFRHHLFDYQHAWMASLDSMGNCAYHGIIPPAAISRVAYYNARPTVRLSAMMMLDPCIHPLNYMVMRGKYEALTRWVFGDPVALNDILGVGAQLMPQEYKDIIAAEMAARDVRIVYGPAWKGERHGQQENAPDGPAASSPGESEAQEPEGSPVA